MAKNLLTYKRNSLVHTKKNTSCLSINEVFIYQYSTLTEFKKKKKENKNKQTRKQLQPTRWPKSGS